MGLFNGLKKIIKKEDDKMKFCEIANRWLKQKKMTIKESTYINYNYVIETYIYPTFRNFNVGDLQEYNFNEYVSYLMKSLSPKTIKDIICLLKAILKFIEDEFDCNLKISKIIIPKAETKNIVVLNKRDFNKLENYCIEQNTLKALGVVISLNTGLRIGEVCSLKWKNIDLDKRILYVEHTLQRIYDKNTGKTKVVITKPKTKRSEREIPISDKLYNILKTLKRKYKDTDFFLTGKPNNFIEPNNYQGDFKKILKNCKIKEHTFHILRHTFATECVRLGMDIKALSEVLGHSSVEITLNRYVHPTYKDKKKYLEKL